MSAPNPPKITIVDAKYYQGGTGFPMDIKEANITIDQAISIKGKDTHGDFEINGTLSKFIKQYVGKHRVEYVGEVKGDKVEGTWHLDSLSDKFEIHLSHDIVKQKAEFEAAKLSFAASQEAHKIAASQPGAPANTQAPLDGTMPAEFPLMPPIDGGAGPGLGEMPLFPPMPGMPSGDVPPPVYFPAHGETSAYRGKLTQEGQPERTIELQLVYDQSQGAFTAKGALLQTPFSWGSAQQDGRFWRFSLSVADNAVAQGPILLSGVEADIQGRKVIRGGFYFQGAQLNHGFFLLERFN